MLPWGLKTNTFTNQPFEFWHTSQKSIRSDLKVAMWASRFFSMSATISGNVSNHQQPFVPPISLGSTPPSAPRMEAARHPHNGWHDMTFDEFEIPRTQTFMAATIASWVEWGRSKILMEEIPNNHLGWCLNFVNDGKKLPTSAGAGFLNHHQYHYFFLICCLISNSLLQRFTRHFLQLQCLFLHKNPPPAPWLLAIWGPGMFFGKPRLMAEDWWRAEVTKWKSLRSKVNLR